MANEIPYLLENTQEWMKGAWRHDEHLLERLFPIDPLQTTEYQEFREKFFNRNPRHNRWKTIPRAPKYRTLLSRRLARFFNIILKHFDIGRDKRLFLNSHTPRRRRRSRHRPIIPGIILSGTGSEFSSVKSTIIAYNFSSCVSPVEVVFESDDLVAARDRLAVHMHKIFEKQDNRRFMFGLVITQETFTVYMFDHSGAVVSDTLNYHVYQDQFCAVIAGLADDPIRTGFDRTMFNGVDSSRVVTSDVKDEKVVFHAQYVVEECIFQFLSVRGRGTVCLLAFRIDDPQSKVVIKDAWIGPSQLPGRESEGSLLEHAARCGVVAGIPKLHHFEEIRRSGDASDLDTILRNRGIEDPLPEDAKLECVHLRMVTSPYCPVLETFETREEFLYAFHDAVLAHRNLHDVAGILHRDISPRNILINANGAEGNRGILIDFDNSIRIDDDSPYSKETKLGTVPFMSRNVLTASRPHIYLDDLESFYYVLCWVMVAYERPHTKREELQDLVKAWDVYSSARTLKHGLFVEEFNLDIAPWFGKSLYNLAERLHDFFDINVRNTKTPISDLNPTKDYDEFLAEIRQGIEDLAKEFPRTVNTPASPADQPSTSNPVSPPPTKKRHESTRRRLRFIPPPFPAARPRRRNANYGLPLSSRETQ